MSLARRSLAAFLACSLSSLVAASEREYTSSFVEVELKTLRPSNLDNDYVLFDLDNIAVFRETPQGDLSNVDFDNELSAKITVGQRFGHRSGWAVSYWDYDESADADRSVGFIAPLFPDGVLVPTLISPGQYCLLDPISGIVFSDCLNPVFTDAVAFHKIEADTLDLYYWRTAIEQERFQLRWMAGVRFASIDSRLEALYAGFDGGFAAVPQGTPIDGRASLKSDAEGLGPMAGIHGAVRLGGRWRLVGGTTIAMLVGSVDARYQADIDPDLDTFVPFDYDVAREEDRILTIIELSLGVEVEIGKRWRATLGYELARWEDSVDRLSFPDSLVTSFAETESISVGWDGLKAGASFEW